jgi:mannan endo-1,4-beta-mannosidase
MQMAPNGLNRLRRARSSLFGLPALALALATAGGLTSCLPAVASPVTRSAHTTPKAAPAKPTKPATAAAVATPDARNQYVTRSGSTLVLAGKSFRFSGTNMYWLALDDNVHDSAGQPTYPTSFRIDDAMTSAQDMGATVVRAWADTVGCPKCIEPTLGTFNAAAFTSLDQAVYSARQHHVRLILTLADNWAYYNGGKLTYTGWRGVAENQFFSDPTVINDYLTFIDHVVTHVNPLTGLSYRDDPTIMAWETGNEMWCQTCVGNYWDGSWTQTVANHLKAVAPHQLVVDGHGTDPSCTTNCLNVPSLSIASVDMVDDHFYPMQLSRVKDSAALAAAHNKTLLVGEYDWVNHDGGASLSSFLSAVAASPAAGDLSWTLIPHADTSGFVDHNDGFQLFYPGSDSDERSRVALLRTHAYAMSGIPVPAHLVPAAPVLQQPQASSGGLLMTWRGSAAAASYTLDRSTDGTTWTSLATGLTDTVITGSAGYVTPAPAAGGHFFYRLAALSLSGQLGSWSARVEVSR